MHCQFGIISDKDLECGMHNLESLIFETASKNLNNIAREYFGYSTAFPVTKNEKFD